MSARTHFRTRLACIVGIAFALATFSIDVDAGDGVWSPAASLLEPRQEIYADVANGRIYVAGGISADGGVLSSAERYDPEVGRWTALAPLPVPRHHIAIVASKDKLYGLGGFSGTWPNWQAQSDVFVYNLAGNSWSQAPPMPTPRGEHVSAVVDGRIYVIGGRKRKTPSAKTFFDHVDTDFNQAFDTTTGEWTERAAMPTARNSHAAAVIDGKIYVVGGRRNIVSAGGRMVLENLDVLEVYSPETDTWSTRQPMPLAQGGLAAAALNGKLYVFGGEQWVPDQRVFSTGWVYTPESDQWAALPDMPTPRHGLAAAAVGGQVFVFGGADRVGFGATGVSEAYRAQ